MQKTFPEDDLRVLAAALEACATHSALPGLFRECGLVEPKSQQGLSKKVRIFNAIAERQNATKTGNFAMKFVQIALWPSRFVDNPEAQEGMREAVNRQLAFRGLYLRPDGKFEAVTPAETVNEARAHANRLREELERIQEAEVLR